MRRKHLAAFLRVVLILLTILAFVPPATAAITNPEANTGLTLPEGGVATITSSQLRVGKSGVPPSELTYRLTKPPINGTLKYDNVPLVIGNVFTQADINAGLLTYTHDGGETVSDSFETVSFNGTVQGMERVSVASDGAQSDKGPDTFPGISSDGRYIAFGSAATNLVPGDTNGVSDIFVHDQQTNVMERVSLATGGGQADGLSEGPEISPDGRYIAFDSVATNLVPNDTNGAADVFVHDRQIGVTERISVAVGGGQADKDSYEPMPSSDGRYVTFSSNANNIVSGDTNNASDVFVYDRQTGVTERISVATGGGQADKDSGGPIFSFDGRYVVFQSLATNLMPNDTNNAGDIFVYDRQTGITERVSIATDSGQANADSALPVISGDGRYIAFESYATNLVPNDTNGVSDVFVHDRQTGVTTRVSKPSGDIAQSNGASNYISFLSSDGRYIAFDSVATNLVPNDTNGIADVFIHDRQTSVTTRVSVPGDGGQANGDAYNFPALSPDGRFVAFFSNADNLVPNDSNGVGDVFVADRGLRQTFAITITPVNDPPTISQIANQRTPINKDTRPIAFTLSDPDSPVDCATLRVTSDTPTVVPNSPTNLLVGARPSLDPHSVSCTLTIRPAPDSTGSVRITVLASDGNGLAKTDFTLTVEPIVAPQWLAILYVPANDLSDGRTSAFETDATLLLERLRSMPTNPDLRLVVLYDGNRNGDSALYVREPGEAGLHQLSSAALPSWFSSELDMGSKTTLSEFIGWAQEHYPGSPHQLLSIIDHGRRLGDQPW